MCKKKITKYIRFYLPIEGCSTTVVDMRVKGKTIFFGFCFLPPPPKKK